MFATTECSDVHPNVFWCALIFFSIILDSHNNKKKRKIVFTYSFGQFFLQKYRMSTDRKAHFVLGFQFFFFSFFNIFRRYFYVWPLAAGWHGVWRSAAVLSYHRLTLISHVLSKSEKRRVYISKWPRHVQALIVCFFLPCFTYATGSNRCICQYLPIPILTNNLDLILWSRKIKSSHSAPRDLRPSIPVLIS